MAILIIVVTLLKMIINQSTASSLVQESVIASTKFYKRDIVTSVVWGTDNSDDVNQFLGDYPGNVVLIPLSDNIKLYCKKDGYRQTVFFSNNAKDFSTFIEIVNQKIIYPIRLILVLTNTANNSVLSHIFETAWRNDLVDIAIISKSHKEEIAISSYFPYNNGICGNFEPVFFKKDGDFFPRKMVNFNRCPMKTTMLKRKRLATYIVKNGTLVSLTGYDGEILLAIAYKLNATVEAVNTAEDGQLGTYYSNGTITGLLGDLINRTSDIFLPANDLERTRYSKCQVSHVYRIIKISWMGPKPRHISPWLKIVYPFFNYITLLLGLAIVTFVGAVMVIKRIIFKTSNFKDSVLFQSYVLLLGQVTQFVTTSPLLNSLFLLWIWFCFIIRIYYQGKLVENLLHNLYEASFQSIEEAVDKINIIYGTESFSGYFKGTAMEHKYKTILPEEFGKYTKRIIDGEKSLLMTITNYKFGNMTVSGKTKIVEGDFIPMCLYMRPMWPAAKELDTILVRLMEGGLIDRNFRENFEDIVEDSYSDLGPLDFSHMGTFFFALSYMWLVCSVVCGLEILYFKYSQGTRNKVIENLMRSN